MNHADLAAAAASRSRFYWWLAGWVLSIPNDADLKSARTMTDVGGEVVAEIADTLNGLVSAARALPDAERESRLGIEYTRLFGGLARDSAPPPPYESVWREDRLVGEATLAVLETYQQAGFADIDPAAGPQDHLGVELKFMSLLALREQEFWLDGDEAAAEAGQIGQRDFLAAHLLAWVPQWVARIVKESHEPFYANLAGLIGAFLELDRQHLENLGDEGA